MKLHRNLVYSVLLVILHTLSHLPCGNARTLASSATVLATTKAMKIHSLSEPQKQNATTVASPDSQRSNDTTVASPDSQRSNDTAVATLPAQTKSLKISQPTAGNVLTHILRKKRETEVPMPFDFNTMHLPCDLDQNGRAQIVDTFPNHCVWVWNNRYVHEGFYRVYKTYQLEAFFFGQYYERLKRFEVDPHTWDYAHTGV